MTATPLLSVAKRLLANVDGDRGDLCPEMLAVPVASYLDRNRYEREIDTIFLRSPLLVAFSVDVAQPGDYSALNIARRPIVVMRGDDGVARTFLNICRHRGAQVANDCFGHARRLTCPYHFWVYDNQGALVGNTAREAFAGVDITGLVELPTAERSGCIFAILTPGVPMNIDSWLGDMASALEILELDKLFRHRDGLVADSGNWKATADGYVDGYHLGFLHRNSIGAKSITNRNTYDLYGPHLRLGFANKPILTMRERQVDEWPLRDAMSLVHFVFPNVSISGLPGSGLMVSRIYPGDTPEQSTVEQFQYFREPMLTDQQIEEADAKRDLYYAVTRDEDFATVLQVTNALGALPPDDVVRYGRNEQGNQNLHRWVDALVSGTTPEIA
jgi:phenylpropionate dioxygenase-like ring-hydroxylating dioxygenase large terminal subunit